MRTNNIEAFGRSFVIGVLCFSTLVARAADDKKSEEQQQVREVATKTLDRLYEAQPSAKSVVENGAGYAVFSNMGVKIFLAGSGKGKGLAVNNKTRKETFMKMLELQAGLGFGVKKFSVIFVFDNENALNKFIDSGWEFGGQADASAKAGDKGVSKSGAISVSDGVWMYEMTEKGLSAAITAKSTKYTVDKDLN